MPNTLDWYYPSGCIVATAAGGDCGACYFNTNQFNGAHVARGVLCRQKRVCAMPLQCNPAHYAPLSADGVLRADRAQYRMAASCGADGNWTLPVCANDVAARPGGYLVGPEAMRVSGRAFSLRGASRWDIEPRGKDWLAAR